MFKFRQERLDEDNLLGSGAFGEVFPYQKDPQDLRWVVKRILAKNIDSLINCIPEIVFGFACDHPCIVSVQGYFIEKVPNSKYSHYLYLKIPRMKESLSQHFKNRKTPFSEKEILQHFYSLVCGLKYLHSKKIYHGDIRHDNLLLDEQGNLKIGDVGIAKHVGEEDTSQTIAGPKGTYFYTAPEILGEKAKKSQLSKADIWSLGIVILELCTFNVKLLNSSLPQDKLETKLEELFGNLKGKYQEGLIALIIRLLSLDPEKRPNIEQVKDELEKSFSKDLNKNLVNSEGSRLIQMEKEHEEQIAILNHKMKETSDKYETETRELKEIICRLESEIIQQQQQNKDQIELKLKQFLISQELMMKDETEIERLEKIISQQFDLEQKNILESVDALQIKVNELETLKIKMEEGNGKDRLENLIKVLSYLHGKCQKFSIHVLNEKNLRIKWKRPEGALNALFFDDIKDEDVILLSKDIIIAIMSVYKILDSFGLIINLSDCDNLTDKALASLSKEIANHSMNIHSLSLDFSNCPKLTDQEFVNLGAAISSHLSLKSLDLCFSYCEKLTDKALADMATAISNRPPSLLDLDLCFDSCTKLTDKALADLTTAISNQSSHLESLSLSFCDCPMLTDKIFANVGAVISSHSLSLKRISLSFASCELTDKALNNLATAISSQSLGLVKLNLYFGNIEYISAVGIEKLAIAIEKSCKNLQYLELSFDRFVPFWSKGISEQKQSLRKRFAHIPRFAMDNVSYGEM